MELWNCADLGDSGKVANVQGTYYWFSFYVCSHL